MVTLDQVWESAIADHCMSVAARGSREMSLRPPWLTLVVPSGRTRHANKPRVIPSHLGDCRNGVHAETLGREGVMAGFVQIIEFTTSRMDEIRALVQEMRDQPIGLAVRGTFTADRDRPGTYINIIEFASREAATANSQRPETQEFATKMTELCEGPAKFYNLDLLETWQA